MLRGKRNLDKTLTETTKRRGYSRDNKQLVSAVGVSGPQLGPIQSGTILDRQRNFIANDKHLSRVAYLPACYTAWPMRWLWLSNTSTTKSIDGKRYEITLCSLKNCVGCLLARETALAIRALRLAGFTTVRKRAEVPRSRIVRI